MEAEMRCGACSILNAREEKLLDGDGRLILRLICNACGHVLDSEVIDRGPRLTAPEDDEALQTSSEA
jgi:hypothetical protein